MKKISILFLAAMLAVGLSACGRRNDKDNNKNDMTVLPSTLPTLETNIPDPDTDTSLPMYTDGTGTTDSTTNGTDATDSHKK